MSNAPRDENSKTTIICASSADGLTIVPIQATSAHALLVEDGTSGTDNGNNNGNAMLDENGVAVWTGISNADGKTVIEIYGNPLTGAILISS